MKSIMSVAVVLVMVFTLVSISEAGCFPCTSSCYNKTPAVSANIGPMCWAGFCPAQKSDVDLTRRDADKPDATCQGAYRYGPTTPDPMGSPGF